MLQLFQSIFGSSSHDTPYPDELIKRAIERAVDATDPRLRALSGYQKKLRAAVVHAIDHIVALVDSMPVPLELSRAQFTTDPELIAYFASFAHAQEVLTLDPKLNQWLTSPDNAAAGHVVMLLLMEQYERQVFGIELEGDMLRREVAQTTVNFAAHRLVDPAGAEETTRRQLKRRAFDHLLTLALARIVDAHAERTELERERYLLRRKCTALAAGRWGFGRGSDTQPDLHVLQRQLAEIESQLKALGAGPGLLKAHLDYVVDVLSQAEVNFWSERSLLLVDRRGVKQARVSANALEIDLTVLRNAAGRRLVARLVGIERMELPPPRDLLRAVERYLG